MSDTPTSSPVIGALAPWFGNNRERAARVGQLLGRLAWCGVPFMGGAPELPHIDCRGGLANDLHRHVVNLARAVKHRGDELAQALDGLLFHPDTIADAQARCRARESAPSFALFGAPPAPMTEHGDVQWAADYFVACWMGRGGHAGKATEFTQGLSFRFTSSGGSSSKRFTSAVESIAAWAAALRRWEFSCLDAREFLDRVRDEPGHGVYADPPWPELGGEYAHTVPDSFHAELVRRFERWQHVRVVVRYGVHPLIERLYPRDRWDWRECVTVNQKGNEVREVLLVRGPVPGGAGGDAA